MTPEGWADLRLSDLANIVGGGTPSRSQPKYWRGRVPWATPTDVTALRGRVISETASTISHQGLANSSASLLPCGSLLMTTRATIGACAINSEPMATNQGFQNLVPKENACVYFLYYLIQHHRRGLERLAAGSTFLEVPKRTVGAFRVAVPPIPEQRKIAAILSAVDDAIEKTHAVIDQVQIVKRGLTQELLTRGLPGRHVGFRRTPIGYLPEPWTVSTVGALAAPGEHSCVGGPFGSDLTRKDYVDSAGVPVIRGSNLSAISAQLNEDQFVFVSVTKANALRRNIAFPGDLVFTQRGTLGQVCRIPILSKFERYVLSQSQMKLSVDERRVHPDFLLAYFRSPDALKLIELMTIGTGVPHLNLGILKAFPVPVPPLAEQSTIVDALSSMDARLVSDLQSLLSLKNLKVGLMSVLVTGELRVTADQERA